MKAPFSYVVLRYMHDVFTREFVNVGVVVHAPQMGFLQMRAATRLKRVLGLFAGLDRRGLLQTLRFLESRFAAQELQYKKGKLDFEKVGASEISKSILPTDDSSLQWSSPGGGVTDNPTITLDDLFERMVTRHEGIHPVVRRDDEDVWVPFERELRPKEVLSKLQEKVLKAGEFRHRFEHAWQHPEGPLHLLLPLSFDLLQPSDVVDKATLWHGRIQLLQSATPDLNSYLLLGRPSESGHAAAFRQAHDLLSSETDARNTLVLEEEATDFAAEFAQKIKAVS